MSEPIKLLITDDVEENRLVLKKICASVGEEIEILTAQNGLEAVEIAEKEAPQIVLMDIMMPEMDGFEATRRIRQINPQCFVIVITALQDTETETKIIKSGANSFLKKPLERDVVKFKIKNYIQMIKNRAYEKWVSNKAVINPFSNEIRSMKTIYYVNDENDLMDFGSWLIELYGRYNGTQTFRFDAKVELLYKMISANLHSGMHLSIIIEDGFDQFYISFAAAKDFVLDTQLQQKADELMDDLVMKNNFIYLRIYLHTAAIETAQAAAAPRLDATAILTNDKEDEEIIKRKIQDDEKDILRKSYTEKIHARDYVESLGDIVDELHDLTDVEKEWHHGLEEFDFQRTAESLKEVAQAVTKYSSIINSLYDFMALSYSLSTLSLFLENITAEQLDDEKCKKLHLILGSILSDLTNWRETIFVNQEAADIHYLDSSLFSSCLQIETVMAATAIEQNDEDDIEFF